MQSLIARQQMAAQIVHTNETKHNPGATVLDQVGHVFTS